MEKHPIIRPPAVADLFYPGDATVLARTIEQLLCAQPPAADIAPKALIAPHAGYIYSGAIAASAYRLLLPLRATINRVLLLGPAHRVLLSGMAVPVADYFETPLGKVPLDRSAIDTIAEMPLVQVSARAHAQEHSLEVQVPFLQRVLDGFQLVPIVVGDCPPAPIANVLARLWGGEETLIIISSDLSHYHPYAQAQRIDARTSASILGKAHELGGEQACGAAAINGLMATEAVRHLNVHLLDIRNSGDTAGDPAGDRAQVVGYGAYALA